VSVADHKVVGKVKQESPFCPNIAAAPEGDQVWLTLKDVGKVMVFSAKPPFQVLKVLDTGPITNHVNIVRNARGRFAYVTVGGRNEVLCFRTDTFEQVARIPVGEPATRRSEEHTSELQSRENLVCRLLLEKKKNQPTG